MSGDWLTAQEHGEYTEWVIRREVIEKCARVVQARLEEHDPQLAEWAAAVIRALKDKT